MKKLLVNRIKSLYTFNYYEVDEVRIESIADVMIRDLVDADKAYVNDFFDKAISGKLGMIYKSPISLLSVFQKYINDNEVVKKYSDCIVSASKDEIIQLLGSEVLYASNMRKGIKYVKYQKQICAVRNGKIITRDGIKVIE